VFRVAHNAALNRRMSAERRLASTGMLVAGGRSACTRGGSRAASAEEGAIARLHDAMKDLPAVERTCVLLRSEGLRYREIAGVLDIGVSTVSDHLERALRKLGRQVQCVTSIVHD
jgi:RNA polymerase sigma-70 factor, ECF subfamily